MMKVIFIDYKELIKGNGYREVKEADSLFGFREDIGILDNSYIVTQNGDCYSLVNRVKFKKLKRRKHSNGYQRYNLFTKDVYVHRLVARIFVDNPYNYTEISHEDNDKTNNNCKNLKWCSRQYNNKKLFTDGIRTSKEMSNYGRLSKRTTRRLTAKEVRFVRFELSQKVYEKTIGNILGISRGVINGISRGTLYKDVC